MEQNQETAYLSILQKELVVALGCTEPAAVAFAAARARDLLGAFPDRMEMHCSGNIVKNVMGVYIPGSQGRKGIQTSAILGAIGGDFHKKLEVLSGISPEHVTELVTLLESDFCSTSLIEDKSNLQIIVKMWKDDHSVLVEIVDAHTNIVREEKDGEVLFSKEQGENSSLAELYAPLSSLAGIYQFAKEVAVEKLAPLLDCQIEYNLKISQEGRTQDYGGNVGQTLLKYYGEDVRTKARAWAAAGSDARMSGCNLPVVVNSGSGNQGMTSCLPVLAYAEYLGSSKEEIYRALAMSNLTTLYQKKFIGKLSAYCGAVSAGAGAGAGIAFLHQEPYSVIANTVINALANVSGIVCDGAKPSCAAKISASVDSAILGFHLAQEGYRFENGDGLVKETEDDTIESIGRMGREGMRATDIEILNIMLGK